ncbi:MAG: glycosyltransferase [Kiritimatiellia bacterium]|jgi:glycosyltransferase involved in cell wall biosynthesis|nr:glycosyltransferase [Kiritimatiellia bacterium]
MAAVHQFVAGFSNGDAISNEAVAMRRLFRSWGYKSEVFSETKRILPELRKQARDASLYAAESRPDDTVLLHLSMGSPVNEIFRSLPCRKAILYHNITPPDYFDLVNKQTAANLARGRKQLQALASTAEVNMADSEFNASELRELGFKDVKVLPLMLDLARLRSTPDRKILKRFDDGKINILFVGRCAPNKKIEDLLRSFAFFNHFVDGNSRLVHVGSFAGTERYYYLLMAQARELGIENIHFAGAVPQAQLNAFYECSSVFLCMSEHEGFCIPLIESMVHNLPVLAYAAGAVPETMAGSGVLVHEKRHDVIAEMIYKLAYDQHLRNAIIAGQQKRLAEYEAQDLEKDLQLHMAPLLSGTP